MQVQLRMHVRVEVAPALCGRERVEERALRMEGVGVPENSSSNKLLPFHAGSPPLEALHLLPPEALEAPVACSVRYDANSRQHDRARALTFERFSRQLGSCCFVLCILTVFGQGNRSHRDRPTETSLELLTMVPAFWAAGDPRIGRYLTGPRPVP